MKFKLIAEKVAKEPAWLGHTVPQSKCLLLPGVRQKQPREKHIRRLCARIQTQFALLGLGRHQSGLEPRT